MNGDMKEGCIEMLRNQQICRTRPFELMWEKSASLFDCECQKTRIQRNNSNGGGRKQDNKKDEEIDNIVQCLVGADYDVKDQDNNDDKSAVSMETEGNESPSQVEDGNFKSEEPDNAALTLLCGYNNDDVYIPSSTKVFDSIDQDHLLSHSNEDDCTVNEETLVFLGMVLSVDDTNDKPESKPDDIIDNEPEQVSIGFDVNNPVNIFATTLH